jgi:hypothetical protein
MGKHDTHIAPAIVGNTAAQIEYWKHGISVSMHFNDMCIRLRVLCLTVLATFFAGAAVSMAQYPDGNVALFGWQAHISAALYAIAIVFVLSLWLLDQGYYYRLLLASVRASEDLEPKVKHLVHDLVPGHTLTQALTAAISRAASSSMANLFYGAQAVIAVLMLISALYYVPPQHATIASTPAITAIGDLHGRNR